MIRGIDVSNHQGRIDWQKVAADGIRFAYAKATQRTDFTDRYYTANRKGAKAAGIPFGAYHYAEPSKVAGSARAQALYFLGVAKPRAGDLLPALDIEEARGLKPPELVAWVGEFVATVRAQIGVNPVIYCSPGFWRSALGNTRRFSGCPLWIAHWKAKVPSIPGGWKTYALWQTDAYGRVNGIRGNADTDVAPSLERFTYQPKPKPIVDEDDTVVAPHPPTKPPESKTTGAKKKLSAFARRKRMRDRIAEAARVSVQKTAQMHYSQQFGKRMWGVNHKVRLPDVPPFEDCSSWVTWLLWQAGAPDPNGRGYDGYGYTGTQINRGRLVSVLAIGDLCFYGRSRTHITHVAVCIEGGPIDEAQVASFGSEACPCGPLDVRYRSDFQFARRYL